MINCGDEVKDKITGFTGIVIAKTEWLNKCTRVLVQSRKLFEEKPLEIQFDIESLEVISKDAVTIVKEQATGGDRSFSPSRR